MVQAHLPGVAANVRQAVEARKSALATGRGAT
jgi:hypothetical protein